jgi:hypothetical protein
MEPCKLPIVHVVQYIHLYNGLFKPELMTLHLQNVNTPFLAKCLYRDPLFQSFMFASQGLGVRLTSFVVCPCKPESDFINPHLQRVIGLAACRAVQFPPGQSIGIMTEEELLYYHQARVAEQALEASTRKVREVVGRPVREQPQRQEEEELKDSEPEPEEEAADTMAVLLEQANQHQQESRGADTEGDLQQSQYDPRRDRELDQNQEEDRKEEEPHEPEYRPRTQNSDDEFEGASGGAEIGDEISPPPSDSHEIPTTTAPVGNGNGGDRSPASRLRAGLQPPPKYQAPQSKTHVYGRKRVLAPRPLPWARYVPPRPQSV